jgi:hypothetical protein
MPEMATKSKGGRPMGKLHQDDVRSKIQVSQLINVLTKQALGTSEDLTPSRLKAIEILLRKSLPDLSAIEVSGDPNNPVKTSLEVTFK